MQIKTSENTPNTDELDNSLWFAVRNGNRKEASALLKRNANPDIAREGGITPLMLAVFQGSISLVNLLSAYRANPFLMDEYGRTAQDFAAKFKDEAKYQLEKIKTVNRVFSCSDSESGAQRQYSLYQSIHDRLRNAAIAYNREKAALFEAVYRLDRLTRLGNLLQNRLIEAHKTIEDLTPKFDATTAEKDRILLAKNGVQVQALFFERQRAYQSHMR